MPTRHPCPRHPDGGWTPRRLVPALLLTAGLCGAGALAHPVKTPAKTLYRIVPLWETYSILPPVINDREQVKFSVPGPEGSGVRAKFFDGRRTLAVTEHDALSAHESPMNRP